MKILSKFYKILTTSNIFNINSKPFIKKINLNTTLTQLHNKI